MSSLRRLPAGRDVANSTLGIVADHLSPKGGTVLARRPPSLVSSPDDASTPVEAAKYPAIARHAPVAQTPEPRRSSRALSSSGADSMGQWPVASSPNRQSGAPKSWAHGGVPAAISSRSRVEVRSKPPASTTTRPYVGRPGGTYSS